MKYVIIIVIILLGGCSTINSPQNSKNDYIKIVKNGDPYEEIHFKFNTNGEINESIAMYNDHNALIKRQYKKGNDSFSIKLVADIKNKKYVETYYYDFINFTTWTAQNPSKIKPLQYEGDEIRLVEETYIGEKNRLIFLISVIYNYKSKKMRLGYYFDWKTKILYKNEHYIEILDDDNKYIIEYKFENKEVFQFIDEWSKK
jgi:hypothetical protein